jgi:hypothetical protein
MNFFSRFFGAAALRQYRDCRKCVPIPERICGYNPLCRGSSFGRSSWQAVSSAETQHLLPCGCVCEAFIPLAILSCCRPIPFVAGFLPLFRGPKPPGNPPPTAARPTASAPIFTQSLPALSTAFTCLSYVSENGKTQVRRPDRQPALAPQKRKEGLR